MFHFTKGSNIFISNNSFNLVTLSKRIVLSHIYLDKTEGVGTVPSGLKAENRLVTTPSFIQSCCEKTSYISAKNSDFITSNLYGLS